MMERRKACWQRAGVWRKEGERGGDRRDWRSIRQLRRAGAIMVWRRDELRCWRGGYGDERVPRTRAASVRACRADARHAHGGKAVSAAYVVLLYARLCCSARLPATPREEPRSQSDMLNRLIPEYACWPCFSQAVLC